MAVKILDSLLSKMEIRATTSIKFKFELFSEFKTNFNIQYILKKLLFHQNHENKEFRTKLFGPILNHLTTLNDKCPGMK